VDRATRAVGQTIQLAGRQDPTKVAGGRKQIIQLRSLLEAFRREDPSPKPQLAVPVSVIEYFQRQAVDVGQSDSAVTVADLAIIIFFFLLCVDKYTLPPENRRTCTVEFRVEEVVFYHGGLIIPDASLLPTLLQAAGVTLRIDNRKNGTQGETTYQHTLPGRRILATDALARRVAAVMAATGSEALPVSCLATDDNASGHALAKMIQTVVLKAVCNLGLW
jgi:hypothetical protein